MAQSEMPRRSIMPDTAKADAIIGDESPAASVAVTHTAAWALMGVGNEAFTNADVARLRETVCTSGVDATAYVWLRSPEFTLPDMLWRVYLLHEWYHRDPLLVAERYAEGSHAPIIQGPEAPVELRPLSLITEEVDSLLHDDLTDGDLEYVLDEAPHVMRALTTGGAGTLWIEDLANSFAHRVAMCHSALLVAADELGVAVREAAVGTFDWPRARCVVADLGVLWTTSREA